MNRRTMSAPGRLGMAMLMAVATLVLVLAGVTAGLVAIRGAQQSAWTTDVDGRLLAGLRQGERLADVWLSTSSAETVIPPDGGGILLADDRFILPSGEGRLTVIAYDGLAGIPACLAQRGSAMTTALPVPMLGLTIPAINPSQTEASAYLLDSLELPEGVARFPRGIPGEGRVWRTVGMGNPLRSESPASPGPSFAETISFPSDGRINVNTASASILRTAYSVLGLGGVEELLECRRRLQTSLPPGNAPAAANGLRLVAKSDRWQMLISVHWRDIHRSWWVDFASASQGSMMVQRHDVRD